MSFGFSTSDFLAAGKVINDIRKSLQNATGAKSEYQELTRELDSLQIALNHLQALPSSVGSSNADLIKYAALSCQKPLEDFLSKIKRYEASLGARSTKGPWKSAANKLRWSFGEKDEIQKLHSYLNIHISTINILLLEHGFEGIHAAVAQAGADKAYVKESLEDTRGIVQCIKDNVSSQAQVLEQLSTMLSSLAIVVSAPRTSWSELHDVVVKTFVSTQQMYSAVLEIKASVSAVDARWTYFQAPLAIEDALGFKFPVPSEYDFDLLNNIIRYRFREGLGSEDVNAGNYELYRKMNVNDLISRETRLLPGMQIRMAILVESSQSKE